MAVVTTSSADLSECTQLHAITNLYLKPIASMVIVVTLPALKIPGVTVSNWEVMERLKSMVAPDVFSYLKVAKSSLELLTFDAEADSKSQLSKFLLKLDGKTIKLGGFADTLKVRAGRKKVPYPKKYDWISFFRDAKGMNEHTPGERPDTVHINNLPTKWFTESAKDKKASEAVVIAVLSKFGEVRAIDIPNNDSYRERIINAENKDAEEVPDSDAVFKTFSHGSNIHFDVFVQYKDYIGFGKCMRALKQKKLMCVMEDNKAACANIEVSFDKTCHLSDKIVKRRTKRREKLIKQDAEEEEKRREEEEKLARRNEIEELENRRSELLNLKEVQDALRQKEERRKEREDKRQKKKMQEKLESKHKKERMRKIVDMTAALEMQRKEEAERLITALLTQISKRKAEEEFIEQRKLAEKELRKQIEAKKRKMEDAKKKEENAKKARLHELDETENELRSKLKRILLEKKERSKEEKRDTKLKNIREKKTKVKSALQFPF